MAQLVHAAGESSPGNLPSGTFAVVLAVKNEQELASLEERLIKFKVPHVAIREPDMDNSLTAIGIAPCLRNSVKKHFSSIPLFK